MKCCFTGGFEMLLGEPEAYKPGSSFAGRKSLRNKGKKTDTGAFRRVT